MTVVQLFVHRLLPNCGFGTKPRLVWSRDSVV
jgi:hypothetical protein